jgi:hypothetical protein
MSFELIEAEKAHYPKALMCRALGLSRSGHHSYSTRGPSRRALEGQQLDVLVAAIFAELDGRYAHHHPVDRSRPPAAEPSAGSAARTRHQQHQPRRRPSRPCLVSICSPTLRRAPSIGASDHHSGSSPSFSKYLCAAHPTLSVSATAVLAFHAFPSTGTHPIKNCDTVRPPTVAAKVPSNVVAAVSVTRRPWTCAIATIIAV